MGGINGRDVSRIRGRIVWEAGIRQRGKKKATEAANFRAYATDTVKTKSMEGNGWGDMWVKWDGVRQDGGYKAVTKPGMKEDLFQIKFCEGYCRVLLVLAACARECNITWKYDENMFNPLKRSDTTKALCLKIRNGQTVAQGPQAAHGAFHSGPMNGLTFISKVSQS